MIGALLGLGGIVKAALKIAVENWRLLAGIAVVVFIMLLQHDRVHLQKLADQRLALIEQERAAVRRAAEQARAQDIEHARAVEQAQAQATKEVSHAYQDRIADLRARHDRLRADLEAAARGGAGADLPGVPGAACRLDAAAEGLGLSAALIASEQAEQLKALQDWVRAQAAVAAVSDQ